MKRGFTLIELMILIVIIGIIIAVIVRSVGCNNGQPTDVSGITTFCLEGQVNYRNKSYTGTPDVIWLKLDRDGKPIPCGQHRSVETN